jgi:hypothetical protein
MEYASHSDLFISNMASASDLPESGRARLKVFPNFVKGFDR